MDLLINTGKTNKTIYTTLSKKHDDLSGAVFQKSICTIHTVHLYKNCKMKNSQQFKHSCITSLKNYTENSHSFKVLL